MTASFQYVEMLPHTGLLARALQRAEAAFTTRKPQPLSGLNQHGGIFFCKGPRAHS